MFYLVDIFNNKVLSKHVKPSAAGKAANKFQKQVRRNNGSNSFIPLTIYTQEDGKFNAVSDKEFDIFYEHYQGVKNEG